MNPVCTARRFRRKLVRRRDKTSCDAFAKILKFLEDLVPLRFFDKDPIFLKLYIFLQFFSDSILVSFSILSRSQYSCTSPERDIVRTFLYVSFISLPFLFPPSRFSLLLISIVSYLYSAFHVILDWRNLDRVAKTIRTIYRATAS